MILNWPWLAPAGFLEADGTTLFVSAAPVQGDPLHQLPAGQAVGIIAIEFATRRRFRVNGTLTSSARRRLRRPVQTAGQSWS